MIESLPLLAADGRAELWAALHKTTPFHLAECERHCLVSLALSADDDVAAHLLLKKVRLARVVASRSLPASIARLNSRVDYRHGPTAARGVRLCHPSALAECADRASVAGLLGAGLIGMSSGQSVLWPTADGRLEPLDVIQVENEGGGGYDGR